MARLEIEANGQTYTVEGVDQSNVGAWVSAIVNALQSQAGSPEGPEPVSDVEDPKQYREVRDVYYVASSSIPNHSHRVVHYGNGIFECPCKGFAHRGYCTHTSNALNQHRSRYGYYGSRG